jgi:hypothetical protein
MAMFMFRLDGGGPLEGIFFFGIAMFMGGGASEGGGLRLGMLHESRLFPLLLLPSMVLRMKAGTR